MAKRFDNFILPELSSTERLENSSPGLDLNHGFLHQIRQHQYRRASQDGCIQMDQNSGQSNYINQSDNKIQKDSPEKRDRCTSESRPSVQLDLKNTEANQVSSCSRSPQRSPSLPRQDQPQQHSIRASDQIRFRTVAMSDLRFDSNSSDTLTIDMEEVDLENYMSEAQPYIHKAINDPGSIQPRHLQDVGRTIVNRAWEDRGYYNSAAKLCQYIFLKEKEQQSALSIPRYAFQQGVTEMCQEIANEWQKLREMDIKNWLNFIKFLTAVYSRLYIGLWRMKGIANVLFACLNYLSSPPCCKNPAELSLLCSVLRDQGCHLAEEDTTRMHELLNRLRDTFLDPSSGAEERRRILPVLELSAGNWELSPCASNLYSQK